MNTYQNRLAHLICLLMFFCCTCIAQTDPFSDDPSSVKYNNNDNYNSETTSDADEISLKVNADTNEAIYSLESNANEEEILVSELEQVDAECHRIGGKLGSVSYNDCLELNLRMTGVHSVKTAPILYKEYPALSSRKPLGKVLLLGGVHGDEYSSVSIVFKWLKTLNRYHSGLFHWRIAPLVNPDGLLKDNSTRTNANGVDINRNFPISDWENTALDYWINQADKNIRKYPGPRALSEPETNWVVDEINRFNPDIIISVHAPHGVVDYDGPEYGPYKLGRLYLNLLGTYPGSLGNYAGIQRQIPVVTIELPYAGIMPTANEISDIWRDLVKWLVTNIRQNQEEDSNQDTDPS